MRIALLLLTFAASGARAAGADGGSSIPEASRQLILVLTPGPDAIAGKLMRFERSTASEPWSPVGSSWPITVGRTGLAAGRGLHGDAVPGLPAKREGDGKSPAGVFALTHAFGFLGKPPGEGGLPYLPLTSSTECVDDVRSVHYARILERDTVEEPDWSSSERMREIEGYEWGVVVAHNAKRIAGGGSCIFLHAWSGPDSPTAGCTAMELARMAELAAWLRAEGRPVLVQLTETAYDEVRRPWRLPEAIP